MTRSSLDISAKIDTLSVEIYEYISSVAMQQGIPFFVVGATARDMIMHLGYGIEAPRATVDIDIAFQVPDWNTFETLKRELIAKAPFTKTNAAHRLFFQNKMPIDIVPFGAIAQADGTISWPPEYAVKMSILGFNDAYRDTIPVRIKHNPNVEVLVASLTSLAALKLIAWEDRETGKEKDAHDLRFIIINYLDCDNAVRLHTIHADLINDNFDYERTGAHLLGRDLAAVLGQEAKETIKNFLAQQTQNRDKHLLVEDMSRSKTAQNFQENLELLKALYQGMQDKTNR